MRIFLAVAFAALGCDSRATAPDPAVARGEARSLEYETCGASADCKGELRCFDHVCRRTARSTLGDYFAAAGAHARGKGDLEAAIGGYAQALAHYDADKLTVPPDVDCAYGAALAAARTNKEHAELGARVLHRCLLAAPVGSRLRDQALAELAGLAEAGLDPVRIGASKLADLYLTRGAARPAPDKVTVTMTATPTPTAKSYPALAAKASEPEVRAALVACWEAYAGATKKDALSVTVGLKITYAPSEYEDEPGAFVLKLDPPSGAPAGSPDAAAEACVRAVVEPAFKAAKPTDAFATRIAVTVK